MAGKNSFRDPVTNVLKAWGYTLTNAPGDLVRPEEDTFALEPGQWRWTGAAWVPFVPPPTPQNPLKALLQAALTDPAISASLKAVLTAWQAQL